MLNVDELTYQSSDKQSSYHDYWFSFHCPLNYKNLQGHKWLGKIVKRGPK